MIKFLFAVLFCTLGINLVAKPKNEAKPNVLVFSEIGKWRDPAHTLPGFYHRSIPAGRDMLTKMAADNNLNVTFTDSSSIFTDKGLKPFDVIIFLNPNGYVFNADERKAFQKFIRKGKGYVGIHAAANCELDWPWYMKLVGVYETGVHANNVVGNVVLQDTNHVSTKMLPQIFPVKDEWLKYNNDVRNLEDKRFKVLAVVEEGCYKPGATTNHAIAWCREYEGARIWYTGFGHHAAAFSDPNVIAHIWGGIQYALRQDSNVK